MNAWTLTDNRAEWTGSAIHLSLDRAAPGSGICVHSPAGTTEPLLQLFGPRLPHASARAPDASETVSRCGSSIRVTFPENDSLPVEHQITWQVVQAGDGHTGVDSVVSARTQLLDASAGVGLWSRALAADLLVLETSGAEVNPKWSSIAVPGNGAAATAATPCVLFRLTDRDLSYVEMVHPADHQSSEIHREAESGHTVLRHTLLSCSLEKGVILRARLRGILLPRHGDEVAAAACFAQFMAADPPLGR